MGPSPPPPYASLRMHHVAKASPSQPCTHHHHHHSLSFLISWFKKKILRPAWTWRKGIDKKFVVCEWQLLAMVEQLRCPNWACRGSVQVMPTPSSWDTTINVICTRCITKLCHAPPKVTEGSKKVMEVNTEEIYHSLVTGVARVGFIKRPAFMGAPPLLCWGLCSPLKVYLHKDGTLLFKHHGISLQLNYQVLQHQKLWGIRQQHFGHWSQIRRHRDDEGPQVVQKYWLRHWDVHRTRCLLEVLCNFSQAVRRKGTLIGVARFIMVYLVP